MSTASKVKGGFNYLQSPRASALLPVRHLDQFDLRLDKDPVAAAAVLITCSLQGQLPFCQFEFFITFVSY